MNSTLVLLIEDDLVDRMACRRSLSADPAQRFSLLEADDGRCGLELARSRRPDCIILDYRLPDLNGLEFLTQLSAEPDPAVRFTPVLMLTGADRAVVAIEAMRRGARDYLVKDAQGRYLGLLPAAIARLLREQLLLKEKRQAEAKFRTLVEQIQAISYIVATEHPERLQYVSPQISMLGYTPEEWLREPDLHAACMVPEERKDVAAAIMSSRTHGDPLRLEYQLRTRDGQTLWFRDQANVVLDDGGRPLFMQGTLIEITASKLAERSLTQSQRALRQLAAHQERIRENERRRIAREIHDELGGLLTGIKAYISVVSERCQGAGQKPDPLLDDTAALAQDAIDTVRRVIADLRPSVLDHLGIWAALEWHVHHVAKRAGLDCHCLVAPDVANDEVDPERSIMLFRIIQEATTNVQRHAQADNVWLRVARGDGGVVVTLEDDGCGIGSADASESGVTWGVLGMQERTLSLGGELTLEPRAGGGTVVRLCMPLDEHHVA